MIAGNRALTTLKSAGNTAAATAWALKFAEDRNLRHRRDELGNVVIWKEASPGYEDHPVVMLQGHLDMVCVHEPDVVHDFLKDPLDLYVDGDYIKARGTSLGGDDGAAVAIWVYQRPGSPTYKLVWMCLLLALPVYWAGRFCCVNYGRIYHE